MNYCSCDTHAHKRVEHISPSSTVSLNLNNNNNASSFSDVLVSERVSSSNYSSTKDANSNDEQNFNNSTSMQTVANELMTDNSSSITSNTPQPNTHQCVHCFEHVQSVFDRILSELDLPYVTSSDDDLDSSMNNSSEPMSPTKPPPAVRISVFDTESNANVCMCSLYSSSFSIGGELKQGQAESLNCLEQPSLDAAPQICPNCRNIIKHQPLEHRKTLVSRRLMLANDIIVNRIDTHYLNTYTSPSGIPSKGSTAAGRQFEPYTPESVESHSPVPESVDRVDFDTDSQTVTSPSTAEPLLNSLKQSLNETLQQPPNVTITVNSSKKNASTNNYNSSTTTSTGTTTGCGGGVSPRQLKSRLEKLKRISDRRKQYQQSRSANNSGTLLEVAASGEELITHNEEPARGVVAPRRNDWKLVDCCRRHCCAIL